ncbi:MAG: hypothetical protein JNL58_02460 [Planctomyces sp.]|nr:hypothetical protein [Planctomyces sp.]
MSSSIVRNKQRLSVDLEASTTPDPANIHQSAEQIVNLMKVAAFILVAVALRHAMTSGPITEEYQPTMPSQTVPKTDPKSELLDLSTVEI